MCREEHTLEEVFFTSDRFGSGQRNGMPLVQ